MADVEEWEAAGLYDPDDPGAPQRLELLRWIADRGISLDLMVDALARGQLNALAGDLALRPGRRLTTEEMAAEVEIDVDLVAEVRRASGFAPAAPGEMVFTEDDIEMYRLFKLADGFFSRPELLRLTRVFGGSLRRMAEAAGETFLHDVEAPMREDPAYEVSIAKANFEAIGLARAATGLFAPMFRAHLELATQTNRSADRSADYATLDLAVGFVDLTGFTHRTSELAPSQLLRLVADFEALAHEVVVDHGGRLVKLIGDEVMFTCVQPAHACEIALALVRNAPGGTSARGGIAFGPAVASGGDIYGDVVNLASRLVDLAVPGEVLVSAQVVAGAADVAVESAGRRSVKGFVDPVRVWSLV